MTTGPAEDRERAERAFARAVAAERRAILVHEQAAAVHELAAARLEQMALTVEPELADQLVMAAEAERDRARLEHIRAQMVRQRLAEEGVLVQ